MEKCLKPIQKAEKGNMNLTTEVNHHYVASRLLALVHFKVTNTATIHHISQSKL